MKKGRKKLKKEYMEAFAEVNEIIKLMPIQLQNKLPKKFCEMVEEEMDKTYFTDIKEPLENCKLKNETIVILGLMYRDFLCDPQKRKELQEKDEKEIQEIQKLLEKEMYEKYNPDDIFKKRIRDNKEENIQSKEMIVIQEEKWYQKIFNIIKNFFKRNNI